MAYDVSHILNLGQIKTILQTLSGEINARYKKPSTGIPASDLASGVIPDAVVVNPTLAGTESDLTGLQVGSTKYVVPQIRPNLLDNWYFDGGGSQQGYGRFPINQRGQTVYNSTSWNDPVDAINRWEVIQASYNVNYHQLTSYAAYGRIRQTVDPAEARSLTEETVTISLYVGINTSTIEVYTSSDTYWGSVPYQQTGVFSFTRVMPSEFATNPTVWFDISGANKTVSIAAVKMEYGSTQTLAHKEGDTWILNETPNYEEQLIRCKTSQADPYDIYANNVISYNAPNPNLLDNWYFVGGGSQQGGGQFPINQRGQTTYSSAGYFIDRWEKSQYFGGTINIVSAGLNLVANSAGLRIQQISEQRNVLFQKTGTFSILTSDGSLYIKTFSIGQSAGGTSLGDKIIFYSTSDFVVLLDVRANNEVTIVAMKLELGSNQTLAHQENGIWVLNEIPNYEEQLIKCKSSTADSGDTYANDPVAFQKSFIKVISETKTTNSGGYISVGALNKIIVLSAWTSTSDVICLVFPSSGADSQGRTQWWVKAVNCDTLNPVANASLDFYFAFVQL